MTRGRRRPLHPAAPYIAAAAVGILLAYSIVALYVFPVEPAAESTAVPNVVGSTFDEASRKLVEAGFTAERGESRPSKNVPASTVIQQEPEGGTRVAAGTKVILHVSGTTR